MKKLLSVLLCVTVSMIFIACQKMHDLTPPSEELMTEINSTTVGETELQSVTSECGQFRTQTQGGWGTEPNGENPGSYQHANFAEAFPLGLRVGCASGGFSVFYSSAGAVSGFLPAGGTASALFGDAIDPASKSIKNVLIGQVTALALSVGFDYYDPNFGPAEENLGNLKIASGPFAGMNIVEFLDLANRALGGCATGYSFVDLNQAATSINENFVDGNTDGGFLTCPTVRGPER
jgi:hypothetical protein